MFRIVEARELARKHFPAKKKAKKPITDPYLAGARAKILGEELDHNPFSADNHDSKESRHLWTMGWREASAAPEIADIALMRL